MKSSFTLNKLDEVNLKQFGIILKDYKIDISKMLEIMLNLKELKKSKIFKSDINRIGFDIAFCLDETIKEINKTYRNKDTATDVITFSLFADDANSVIVRKKADLGQIIVSLETAKKQSKENHNTLRQEVLTLICHGILHLLGFDHLTKLDYDFVVSIQNKVIGEL